jgi:hypothetical protein
VIDAKALYDGPEQEVCVRVGGHEASTAATSASCAAGSCRAACAASDTAIGRRLPRGRALGCRCQHDGGELDPGANRGVARPPPPTNEKTCGGEHHVLMSLPGT